MKPFLFHFLCLSMFLGLNAGGTVLTEEQLIAAEQPSALVKFCLLYTSDAADE